MEKIETLATLIIESDKRGNYAGAYGAMKSLAETMFARLSPEDQGFMIRVFDRVIEQEIARKSA